MSAPTMPEDLSESFAVPLAVRIGVVGHRPNKLAADRADLKGSLARILGNIRDSVHAAAKSERAGRLYDVAAPPRLTLISSLAEGADRLAAHAALDQGYALFVPLPFAEDTYRATFEGDGGDDPIAASNSDFATLLEAAGPARTMVLDGDPADAEGRNRAYAAGGRYVACHADALIAVWDGKGVGGEGGTAQAAAFAFRHGVPVIRIDPETTAVTVARDPGPGRRGLLLGVDGEINCAWDDYGDGAGVDRLFKDRLLPAIVAGDETTAVAVRFDAWRRRPSGPVRCLGGVFACMTSAMRGLWLVGAERGKVATPAPPDVPPSEAPMAPLLIAATIERADRRAKRFAGFHHAGYVFIYLLGTLALAGAIVTLGYAGPPDETARSGLPVPGMIAVAVLLGLAALLLLLDRLCGWRARWIEHRVLAELMRHVRWLARIGQAIPAGQLSEAAHVAPGASAWVFHVAAAVQRAVTPLAGRLDQTSLDSEAAFFARDGLWEPCANITYEASTNRVLAWRLAWFGGLMFALAAVAIAIGLAGWRGSGLADPALWAAILAVFGAATFLARLHGGFNGRAARSEKRAERFGKLLDRVAKLREGSLAGGLSAERLGWIMSEAADLELQAAAEWATIASVREADAA